ncbi:MAG TPA: hypothetical protein VF520_15225 [Thermoleophilaceae bacterium]|jgi:hypothetical protein
MNSPSLATGVVVSTLLAHRRNWVLGHEESIELRGTRPARRRVRVEFELPGIAWAAVPRGDPIVVPLATRPKRASSAIDVRDEDGEPVVVLPDGWSAEIAADGLLATARAAGAEADPLLADLVRAVVEGSPADAHAALGEMALGASDGARRAWMHEPFRAAATLLAERRLLLVAIVEGDRPRTLTYAYEERPAPVAAEDEGSRLSRRLGWDGLRLRFQLPHLGDSARHGLEVDAGASEAEVEVDEAEGAATVHVTAAAARSVRWGPAAALLAALLLSAGWVAAPTLDGESSPLLALLGLPAVLAAYLAGRPERDAPVELVRGVRALLVLVATLALTGEALLASGASTAALRVGCGVLALVAWVVAALLLETRRRALGGARPRFLPSPPARRPRGDGRRLDPTRAALLACAIAAGLMVVAFADVVARDGDAGAHALLWAGLLAIFVPALVHAWSAPPRAEAVLGVVLLGLALYLVKVLHSPLHFTFHDEFSTLRTTVDIERSGTLFESNPLIQVHPFYPALELVTSAVASVTGLSTFVSGLIVIGVLRVALMAALFLIFESATSTRVAALATVLYACNPNFVFFDSQWAYESFALPLALVVAAMAARGGRSARLAIPIVVALCLSHPLTSIALTAFLVVWAGIETWTARRGGGRARRELWVLALVGAVCMTLWATLVARSLGGYLGPVIGDAGSSLADLLLGESGPKRIFGAAGAADTPLLERAAGFAAVLLALAGIALGARAVWRRFEPLAAALVTVALAYPLTLPLRLTEAGTEISNRASEFVFVGVALLGALALVERRRAAFATPLVVAAAGIAFVGGVVIGTARWARLPGGYLVSADERSVEPEGRLAARWARQELGTRNRIFADRVNGLLMGSIGLQDPQVGEILGRPVSELLTAPTVDDDVRLAISADRIGYLVVDKRLATGLPEVGFYFEREEPGAYRHRRPLGLGGLVKYDLVCPVGRAFDSGDLVVYDTRRMSLGGECPARPPGRGAAP